MWSTDPGPAGSASSGMLPLRCGNCGNDLHGLSTDVIFYCGNCGRCWILEDRFRRTEIEFVRTGGKDSFLMPFWKVDATVSIYKRITRRESTSSIIEGLREFTGSERGLTDAPPETRKVRLIFPAFATSLVLSTGVKMYSENFLPEIPEKTDGLEVLGGAVGLQDAMTIARGVAVGVEVNRSDFLAAIDLDIEVTSTGIYAIGCTAEESYLRINGSGIGIPYSALRDHSEILLRYGH